MEQIPLHTKKGLKGFELALIFGLLLVFVVFIAWYFLKQSASISTNTFNNNDSAANERARILSEMNAVSKNLPPLTPEEKAHTLSEMEKAAAKLPPPSQ